MGISLNCPSAITRGGQTVTFPVRAELQQGRGRVDDLC
jgi:hypothetical protein